MFSAGRTSEQRSASLPAHAARTSPCVQESTSQEPYTPPSVRWNIRVILKLFSNSMTLENDIEDMEELEDLEEDEQLGTDSEEEDSELSDSEVRRTGTRL